MLNRSGVFQQMSHLGRQMSLLLNRCTCCWTGLANAAPESLRRIWKSSCLTFLLTIPSCVCPWPQHDHCHYFAGVLFDLRGLMAPTLMSESHPFLWKATKTRRPPPPAFTGRADRVRDPQRPVCVVDLCLPIMLQPRTWSF